jgi:signal transduction histidine kinase
VPLTVADEVYGSLVLYYSEPRTFDAEQIALAIAFADQAALAIENAWLHEQARGAAVTQERSRLARELHDSVTQQMYSLTLLAEGWRRLARAGQLEDVEAALAELGEIAQQALKEMRLMIYELRTPALERVGFLAALQQRLALVENRSGIQAQLVAEEPVELPPALDEGLYRIAVEALNNSLKHAAATEVTVSLRCRPERIELAVIDNGLGFDPAASVSRGLGLSGLYERAEKLGGTLAIESAPSHGTTVRVSFPARSGS